MPAPFYFQWVENSFQENADTEAGSHVHRNVDAPSKLDDPKELGRPAGAKLRSLRLESESPGLVGVVDIVEGGPDGAEIIDYKKGSARRDSEGERVAKEPDAMQVAAHALLLREHAVNAVRGAIYYAADKRRVPVELAEELLAKTRQAISDAKAPASSGRCPPPLRNDARRLYCSAYPICLPNETLWWSRKRSIPAETDRQIQFAFLAPPEESVRDRILDAVDFAAKSGKSPPTLEPPRPEQDEGEVLVVQTPGALIGQRGEQLTVSGKHSGRPGFVGSTPRSVTRNLGTKWRIGGRWKCRHAIVAVRARRGGSLSRIHYVVTLQPFCASHPLPRQLRHQQPRKAAARGPCARRFRCAAAAFRVRVSVG